MYLPSRFGVPLLPSQRLQPEGMEARVPVQTAMMLSGRSAEPTPFWMMLSL
jgi:hypothetical protein